MTEIREVVMIWDRAAVLNHMGYAAFGKIFSDSLVPIKHLFTRRGFFQDLNKSEEFYLVDIEELQEKAPDKWRALLQLLSQIHGDPEEELIKYYQDKGLQLRRQLVSEVVYKKYYSAWEISEAMEELLGQPLDDGGYFDWDE